jgi:hypothetical protein
MNDLDPTHTPPPPPGENHQDATVHVDALHQTRFWRLRAAHENWFRPVIIGVLVTVIGGLILTGILLLLNRTGSQHASASQTSALVLDTVSSIEARDATENLPFTSSKVPVDPDNRVVFRVRLHNWSARNLTGVEIWPELEDVDTLVHAAVGFSAFDGVQSQWTKTAAQLSFEPSRQVGSASLESDSFELLDAHLHPIRKLAPEVTRSGSTTNLIAIGSLAKSKTVYVQFAANVARQRPEPGQLGGGFLIAVRNASTSSPHYRRTNFVATPGETLIVSIALHNTRFSPVVEPAVRVTIARLPGFARITARITSEDTFSGVPVTSLPTTINYAGDQPLSLQYVPGSTEAFRCHHTRCGANTYSKSPLPDGIVQGGIVVAPAIGMDARSKPHGGLMFVNFQLRVAPQ